MIKNISFEEMGQLVRQAVMQTPVFDIHTHLFPRAYNAFFVSGLENILTYHYLTTEFLAVTKYSPRDFFAMPKNRQAQLVWDELFCRRTPISEAARGVVTILNTFGIEIQPIAYELIKNKLQDLNQDDYEQKVFSLSGVTKVTMTNDPFNEKEWLLFKQNNWDRNTYISAVRLDKLFTARKEVLAYVKKLGFKDKRNNANLSAFFDSITETSKARYFAISLDGKALHKLLNDAVFVNILLPWLEDHNIPLALMLGVKRSVNPALGPGGDGVSVIDLESIESLAATYPRNRFLVTTLGETVQHALAVLARKFSNLNLFGFWWFDNQPSIIRQKLAMRFDLLGFNFIPQYSDARVFEHLIYKWLHFKEILTDVISDHYRRLLFANWLLSSKDIKRDIHMLLYGNAENFLKGSRGL